MYNMTDAEIEELSERVEFIEEKLDWDMPKHDEKIDELSDKITELEKKINELYIIFVSILKGTIQPENVQIVTPEQ